MQHEQGERCQADQQRKRSYQSEKRTGEFVIVIERNANCDVAQCDPNEKCRYVIPSSKREQNSRFAKRLFSDVTLDR